MITKVCTLILLALFLISSCKTEEANNNSSENSIANTLKVIPLKQRIEDYAKNVMHVVKSEELDTPDGPPETETSPKLIIVRWSDWGRKAINCRGWGLCHAEWLVFDRHDVAVEDESDEPVEDDFYGSIIEINEASGMKYFDILFAESPDEQLDSEDLQFHVDEEICLTDNLYVVPNTYGFQSEIGEFGGYRILLDEQ